MLYFAYSVFLVLVRLKHFSVTNSEQKISVEDAYLDFRLEECSVPRGDTTSTLIFKISFSSNCKLLTIGKRGVHCLYDRSCDSNRTSCQAGKKVRDRRKTRISDHHHGYRYGYHAIADHTNDKQFTLRAQLTNTNATSPNTWPV